jgi:hypothetical protein
VIETVVNMKGIKKNVAVVDIFEPICVVYSVAEPEPETLQRQLFTGAGAERLLARLPGRVCKFL